MFTIAIMKEYCRYEAMQGLVEWLRKPASPSGSLLASHLDSHGEVSHSEIIELFEKFKDVETVRGRDSGTLLSLIWKQEWAALLVISVCLSCSDNPSHNRLTPQPKDQRTR
jgi:hypothetical protein